MSLGSWRFFLAMLVAFSHLRDRMIHGPAAYAVWGHLSYPVYLFHTVTAVWWLGLFGMHYSLGFMLAGLAGTLVLSWLVVAALDQLLEKRFNCRRAPVLRVAKS